MFDHFWRFRCRKRARRCGAKHISKVKMFKTLGVRTTFGGSDVASLRFSTLHYITLHSTTTLHYTPLHYTTLQLQVHNYTPLHKITLHYTTTTRLWPPSYKWVIIPVTIDISPINHSYWTDVHQLSDSELGHHPVQGYDPPSCVLVHNHYYLHRYIYHRLKSLEISTSFAAPSIGEGTTLYHQELPGLVMTNIAMV